VARREGGIGVWCVLGTGAGSQPVADPSPHIVPKQKIGENSGKVGTGGKEYRKFWRRKQGKKDPESPTIKKCADGGLAGRDEGREEEGIHFRRDFSNTQNA